MTEEMRGYCMKCKTKREISEAEATFTKVAFRRPRESAQNVARRSSSWVKPLPTKVCPGRKWSRNLKAKKS